MAIDLFAGICGWGDGLIAEGWQVISFDIVDMRKEIGIDEPRHPDNLLVLQDVMTLHGSQFRTADLIVASPPCQAYSYRAMPWKRAKALPPPDNTLFEACFRIQHEASEAAGRHIPLIVENVRGAQKWVGRSRWNFGSYHLWGDVPALMPMESAFKGGNGSWFAIANNTNGHSMDPVHAISGIKVGGSWFHDNLSPSRMHSSKSPQRKRASAMIAKIPLPLAQHIGRVMKPTENGL